jgi:hypothetical protein
LRVGVSLTDELRQAKFERHSMGDTWVIPIGENLCKNSEMLARQLFSDVKISTSEAQLKIAAVDAILSPRLAFINQTVGATSFGKSIIAIKVEWTLADANGKLIWVDTIGGEGSGSTGWTNPEKIVKEAVEQLFLKSHEAMANSAEIKQAAAKR